MKNNTSDAANTQYTSAETGLTRRQSMGLMLGAAMLPLAHATAANPVVIQFSHVVTADTPKGRAALRFKELAESRTQGRVRVEVYANSSLYKDREEMDALRLGAVQMLAPSLSKLASVGGGDLEVFDLPYLFRDHAEFRTIANGPIGAQLLRRLETKGVKGLAYWDNGFKVFTANRALRTPQDFEGLRIRVQASRTLVSQMQQLRTDPSVSPLINVYEALRTHKLDGQENTPVNIYSQKLHEMQSHLTVSNHGYLAYAVIVNQAFWDRLPDDLRSILEGAMRDATAYANSLAEAANLQALERIQATGRITMIRPTAAEQQLLHTALAPVYQAAKGWIQPELVQSIRQTLGAPP